ncbi:MAG TPA: hypothetical protein PK098_02195 [Phycisphaerales bacterium]|nr:hypothetical protein [Phycisphaerales bacterium]
MLATVMVAAIVLAHPQAAHSSDFSPNSMPFDSCGTVIIDEFYYCYLFHADVDGKIYYVPGVDEYTYSPGDRLHVQGTAEYAAGFCTLHGNINDPTISPCEEVTCQADLTGDGNVDVGDLLSLLGQWGPCGYGCNADLTGDGNVGVGDLLVLLGAWGPCE